MTANFIQDALNRRVIFVTGKGGVGKSTIAWAMAVACQRKGLQVKLVSWNPFDSFAKPQGLNELGVEWEVLDGLSCFKEYALHIIKFEKIYDMVFENHVLKTFIQAAPGLSESVIAGKIWQLNEDHQQDLIIVDLPSTGHALSFFESPLGLKKIFLVGFVHRDSEKIVDFIQSADTRLDLVSLPEELPSTEIVQFKDHLQAKVTLHFGFHFMNQCPPTFEFASSGERTNWSEQGKALANAYEMDCEQRENAQKICASLELPLIEVSRMAYNGFVDLVTRVADQWTD